MHTVVLLLVMMRMLMGMVRVVGVVLHVVVRRDMLVRVLPRERMRGVCMGRKLGSRGAGAWTQRMQGVETAVRKG